MLTLRKRYNHAVTQAHYCRESIDWFRDELGGALATDSIKVSEIKENIRQHEDSLKTWVWLANKHHMSLMATDEFDLSINKEKAR